MIRLCLVGYLATYLPTYLDMDTFNLVVVASSLPRYAMNMVLGFPKTKGIPLSF